MSFQSRTLVAIALCAVIYLVFEMVLRPYRPVPEETAGPEQVAAEVEQPQQAEAEAEPVAEQDRQPEPSKQAKPAQPREVEPIRHVVANDMVSVELTNEAPHERGIVAGVELLSEQFQGHDTALDALQLGGASTLAISFADAATDFRIPRNVNFSVRDRSERHVTLAYEGRDVEIVERFDLLEGYEARLTVEVRNTTQRSQVHRIKSIARIGEGEGSRYDIHRGVCRTQEDLEEEDTGDVEDGPISYAGSVRWGAADSKYFMTAVVPKVPFANCKIEAESGEDTLLATTLESDGITLEPGASAKHVFGVYLGAKELDRLKAFDAIDAPEVELEEAIDWGFFGGLSKVLGKMLLRLLRWLHEVVNSWGWAIVLLTVVVKLATLPLTLKQMHSMKRMKEIQPEIASIKEKYGEDRVKQGQEMQALFARSGVNPLAGCLPMLVQLPVWFALYSMLLTAVELVHIPFLWLPDLTKSDPYFALPLALGALMIVQNRMMPVQDETQAKLMRWFMPIMFTAFMLFLPSGLALYIFTNIVLSVIQTAIQMKTGKTAEATS